MEVIIIESEAFYKLLELAVERVGKKVPNIKRNEDPGSEWLSLAEAMKVLPIAREPNGRNYVIVDK